VKTEKKSPSFSWLIFPAIVLLGFILYANSFKAPFLFDDRHVISENPKIKIESLTQLGRIIDLVKEDRPLTTLSLALNYYLHRFRLPGYHFVNVCLHIICGILFYFFLCQLLERTRYKQNRIAIASLAALLFTAHPIQTQAVTYIVQRGTSLATLFYLLSLLSFILGRERKRIIYYVCSVIAGLLALASKQIAVTLPLIVLLYDFYFYRDQDRDKVREVLPFYLVLLALPLVLAVMYTRLDLFGWLRDQYQARPFTPYQRVLTEFRVIGHYLTLLLFPLPGRLNIDHHFSLSLSPWSPPSTLFAGAFLLVLLGLGLVLRKKRPVVSFFILWFLINLLLESSILGLELVFEHRMYLPSVAFFSLVGIFLFGSSRIELSGRIWPVGIALIFFYGWGTIVRNRVWQTELSLWQDAATKSPRKPRVLYNLGHALFDQNRYGEALSAYQAAVRLNPDYPDYYNNLGLAYGKLGRHREAIDSYHQGLRLAPRNSRLYNNLGNAYKDLGQYEEAIAAFKQALSMDPNNYRALSNLGVVYYHQEKYKTAIDNFLRVITDHPEYGQAYLNLALLYKKQKEYKKAIETLDGGIRALPGDVKLLFLRGKLHRENKSPVRALSDFSQCRELDPDSWEIRNALGELYRDAGNFFQAAVELEAATRLKPDLFGPRFKLAMVYKSLRRYTKAENILLLLLKNNQEVDSIYYNLGNVCVGKGDYSGAVSWFEKAVEKKPDSREFAHNLALARLKSGDLSGAEKDLLALIKRVPNYMLARENLAFLYLKKEEPQQAISIFQAMLKDDPHRFSALNNLGMIFYKNLGQKQQAVDYFRRSIAEAPDQPGVERIKSLMLSLERQP